MANVHKLDIRNHILSRARALGNNEKGLKEVCSDLVNSFGVDGKALDQIARGTFLSESTIKRMATLKECDTGEPYRPQVETIERILRFFGAEVRFEQVTIKSAYANKPKTLD